MSIPKLFTVHHSIPKALFQEFRTGCPREDEFADDLVIITESLEELQEKAYSESLVWKDRDC